jgi:predicted N-acetyltransferase YhbS
LHVRIVRREEDRLSEAESDELTALLGASFGGPFRHRIHYKQLPSFRFLALLDGGIVSQVGICHRMMRLGDVPHRVFGVIDLCVAETVRGRGIGRRLMERCILAATRAGTGFMVLFADEPALYQALGFRCRRNPCVWVVLAEHRTLGLREGAPPDRLMVLPLGAAGWNDEATLDLLGYLF